MNNDFNLLWKLTMWKLTMQLLFRMTTLAVFISTITACGSGSSRAPVTSVPVAPAPVTPITSTLKVLAIGDSFFEWHVESQQSIPDEIGKALQASVDNRAISGANFYAGGSDDPELINVKDQYEAGNWDWVVMTGGGNDVNDKCECNSCDVVVDELISMDATTGELPNLVNKMQQNGHKVVYVMYPEIAVGAEYGFSQCTEEFIELEFRFNQLALNTKDFWFVSASDVVPRGDNSYFVDDLVHPSTKSTAVIGKYVAETIQSN